MTDLEYASPLDEGDNAQDPILPPAQGDSSGDQVVGKREGVVEQIKEVVK
jgi:hypothetical protein